MHEFHGNVLCQEMTTRVAVREGRPTGWPAAGLLGHQLRAHLPMSPRNPARRFQAAPVARQRQAACPPRV
jgi:hypothetical protein